MNATVLNSIDDHRHEVMSFVWENGYHGVMSDDGEYALFNPPRYFSAHDIKLSLQQVGVYIANILSDLVGCLRGHQIDFWIISSFTH